jgi:hypothetical protein
MNHKKHTLLVIIFILAMLVVSGCAPPQATPCPTSEPQSCPTAIAQTCPTAEPQSCPTAAAQAVPGRSGFRGQVAVETNAVITFDPGDKCSMRVLNQVIKEDGLLIEVVANDNAYQDYIVWIHYLDPGKTLEDLKTQATDPITPPSFLHILGAVLASPMSRTTYAGQITIDAEQGPIYFTCQVYGPGPRKNIDQLGPLEIKQ